MVSYCCSNMLSFANVAAETLSNAVAKNIKSVIRRIFSRLGFKNCLYGRSIAIIIKIVEFQTTVNQTIGVICRKV